MYLRHILHGYKDVIMIGDQHGLLAGDGLVGDNRAFRATHDHGANLEDRVAVDLHQVASRVAR